MGQILDSMTQNQSKEELLYQQVNTGNVEAITALCREGANLKWTDEEGKTPLIVACLDSGLFNVAKTLIEMGANLNAYRPGRHAGTPLHHAAKSGLKQTVLLLLSSGANALVRNDDCHTALDVARIKGQTNVVRAIENHISYFSGWLRELHGPSFLENIWVAVIPCGSTNPMEPARLGLAIYVTLQDAQPRTVIALWKAKIEEPKFHHSDPILTIFDNSTETRYKFASANEGDKQQLHRLYDACRGIPHVMPPPTSNTTQTTVPEVRQQMSAEDLELAIAMSASMQSAEEERPAESVDLAVAMSASIQTAAEDLDLAMALSASIQSAAGERPAIPSTRQSSEAINANGCENSARHDNHNGWGLAVASTQSEASSSGWMKKGEKEDYSGWGVPNSGPIHNQGHVETHDSTVQAGGMIPGFVPSAPSAPPIPEEALSGGPIHYPPIDFSPVDSSVPPIEHGASVKSDMTNGNGSSSCIICWEAPVEGASIPCGHMAGCMACLNEIKEKKGVCPVCRAKIKQVIRVYAV